MTLGKSNSGGGLEPNDIQAGVNITVVDNLDGTVTINGTGGATLGDGDYGDITVSASGTQMTIDNQAVTLSKIQNINTNRLLGRSTTGSGSIEQLNIGSGLNLSGGTLSSSITQYTNEDAQDAVGSILTDSTTIDFTYDDALNTISASVIESALDLANLSGTLDASSVTGLASVATSGAYSDLTGTPTIPTSLSDLSGTSDDVTEGVTNLYFTDEKAQDAVGNSIDNTGHDVTLSYDDVLNTLSADITNLNNFTSDDLSEGITNLYYTDSKVYDATKAILQAGANITLTPDDLNETITIAASGGGGGGGSVNSASNIGTGEGVFKSLVVDDLQFKSLNAGSGITITGNTNDITIGSSITQYTNEQAQDAVGNALVDSTTVNFTYNDGSNTITADVLQGALDHTQFLNIGTNSHSQIDTHIASTSNPHSVTKTQVGLSNVANVDTTTTANISDSLNKRFVTDAQLTVLGNTSGTNTGDQDLSGLVPKTTTVNGYALSSNVTLAKGDVGLGNVDNTSDATKNSASVTLTNKTLDNTNTVELKDTLFTLQDNSDSTKKAKFELSGISASTTRTYTLQNSNGTIALTTDIIDGGSA